MMVKTAMKISRDGEIDKDSESCCAKYAIEQDISQGDRDG